MSDDYCVDGDDRSRNKSRSARVTLSPACSSSAVAFRCLRRAYRSAPHRSHVSGMCRKATLL